MSRAFIFTMDAVLAFIPLFIALGAISHIGGGGSLYLQGSILGQERLAQDIIRIMEVRGDIRSTNATELNTTLQQIVPSYLNYNYVAIDTETQLVEVNLSRGEPSNTTDIIPTGNVIAIGSKARNVTASPNLLVKSFVETQDEADALSTLLLALVGLTSHGGKKAIVTDLPTATQWNSIGLVTVQMADFSTYWGSSNGTLDFMLDRLIASATTQGKIDAVNGLTQLKLILDNASRGSLTYSMSAILDPYPVPSTYENMTVGAADIVYAAFQSANYNLGATTSTNITSSDGNYSLRVYARIGEVGKIYIAVKGSILPSETGDVTVEVWRKNVADNNYTIKDTLQLQVLRRVCFNVTDVRLQSLVSGILNIDVKSGACSPSGLINATVKNETTSSSASIDLDENSRYLAPNLYPGIPMVEGERIFNVTATGSTFFYNYNNSINAAGSELSGILSHLPLTRVDLSGSNTLAEKRGQVNVGSVIYSLKRYIVTIKLWGD